MQLKLKRSQRAGGMLGAKVILDACKSLKAYLETAQTFDGREEVVEF